MSRVRSNQRGAAAVEFALILPLLALLLFGIFEFGRIFNVQINVSNSAREAARVMAIDDSVANAQAAAIAASAPSLTPDLIAAQITLSPASCEDNPGDPVTATVKYPTELLFPGFWEWASGTTLTLTGSGQMICGG